MGGPIIAWGLRRARRLERSKQVPQALKIALRLANVVPAVPVVQFYLARLAMVLGDADTARRALYAAIQGDQLSSVKSYSHVARKLMELNDLVAAEGCLEKARAAFPTSSRVWSLLGELQRVRGNPGDAECCFNEALSHASSGRDRFGAVNGLAGCFADTGRKYDAKNVYTRMIELGPDAPWACYCLVHSQGNIGVSDVIVRTMIEMLESGRPGSEGRMNLHYALGMVFDGAQQYGEAFAHFMLANAIRARRIGRYDEESLRRSVDAKIQTFSQERIADLAKYGDQSEFLICIVGMPRSGTTLLEQILSSHPGVVGLGERLDFWNLANGLQRRLRSRHPYPLCCRAMSPQEVRDIASFVREQLCRSLGSFSKVVTKLPGDCWEVGLIKVLFPRAKIVHSRRGLIPKSGDSKCTVG